MRFPQARDRIATSLVCAVLLCAAGHVAAEVSFDTSDWRPNTLLMSITDGVDPIPQIRWHAYRNDLDWVRMLNPLGDSRPDGPPSIAWKANGWPVVVWGYLNQDDHDIAFAEWTGEDWSVEFLTSSTEDERDPRVFVEPDGTLHVVWWINAGASSRVVLLTRNSDGDIWQNSVIVSPFEEVGRRPTVAVHEGTVRVAYERDVGTETFAESELVIWRRENNGSFIQEAVLDAEWVDPMDPILHVRGGRLWISWKYSSDQFGYSERLHDGWEQEATRPWTDPSWVGIETARLQIQTFVVKRNTLPPTDP